MSVKFKPNRYHTITPYLTVTGAVKLLAFLEEVFDARELEKFLRDDGTIEHAEIQIGDSVVMLGEVVNEADAKPSTLYTYVPDTTATYEKALAAGATSIRPPTDQWYGDRNAAVKDPTGNAWWIATHIEDLTPEEVQRRAAEAAGQ